VRPPGAASPSANQDEIPLASLAGRMKKFSENTSTISEVMDSSTVNFNPIFFTIYFFRVCASKPWLISSVCKNSRAKAEI